MARKSKQKKTQRTRKQKPKTREHLSAQLTTPDIKISEAILKLCESQRNKYRESHKTQAIISMTVMAWNISLFPKEEQTHVQGMLLDALPEQLSGEDVAVLLKNIESLIERKEKDYPHIREYILKHQLSFSGDAITLMVGTAPVPEKIQRRVP